MDIRTPYTFVVKNTMDIPVRIIIFYLISIYIISSDA